MVCVPHTLTKDGFVIMASEIGVLDIKPEDVTTWPLRTRKNVPC
jgi:hypothetical protein